MYSPNPKRKEVTVDGKEKGQEKDRQEGSGQEKDGRQEEDRGQDRRELKSL